MELQRKHFFLDWRNFLGGYRANLYLCSMKNIAVFASGSGSNAENLMRYFNVSHPEKQIRIGLVVANRPDAYVLERAGRMNVSCFITDHDAFYNHPSSLLQALSDYRIDYIVLAGFLWLIPPYIVEAYPNRVVNIHPALLPAYGGKGMYGIHVHRAVIAHGEKESGITIHVVDEQYDHGSVLFQVRCRVDVGETPDSLAQKIHLLEQEYLPKTVDDWISGRLPL